MKTSDVKEHIRDNQALPTWYKIVLLFNGLLVVAGFFCPPIGVIDGSVLTAVGEISLAAFLGLLPSVLKNGKGAKISKGDMTIEVQGRDNE